MKQVLKMVKFDSSELEIYMLRFMYVVNKFSTDKLLRM